MQVDGLCGADWISCLTSIWQDNYDVVIRRRGPVPAIGPGKAKGSTSLKNNIASMNQKMRNMNTVLGRV
jgi:hypothetical protein